MTTVSQLVEDVSYVCDERRARVYALARNLIDNEVLPKSSGRAIEHCRATDVAALLAAVAFADKAADAARCARVFMALSKRLPEGGLEGAGDMPTLLPARFGDAIAFCFQSKELPFEVEFQVDSGGQSSGVLTVFFKSSDDGGLKALSVPYGESWMMGHVRRTFVLKDTGCTILRNLFQREGGDDETVIIRRMAPFQASGDGEG